MSSVSLPSLPIELFPSILSHLEPTDWFALQLTSQNVRVKTRHLGARFLHNATFVYSREGLQKLLNITNDASLMSGLQRFTLRLWNPHLAYSHQDSYRSKTVEIIEWAWEYYISKRDTAPFMTKAESLLLYEKHAQRQKLLRDSEEDLLLMNKIFTNFAQFAVKLSLEISDVCKTRPLVVGRPFDRHFFDMFSRSFTSSSHREVVMPSDQTVQITMKAATGTGVDLCSIAIHPVGWKFLDFVSVDSFSSSQRACLANVGSFELHVRMDMIRDAGGSSKFEDNLMALMSAMTGLQQLNLHFGLVWIEDALDTPGSDWNHIPDLVLGLEFSNLHKFVMEYSKASAASLSGFLARHTTLQILRLEQVSLVNGDWEKPFDTLFDLHKLWLLHLARLTVYNIDDGEEFYTAYSFPSCHSRPRDALRVEDATEIPKALETVRYHYITEQRDHDDVN